MVCVYTVYKTAVRRGSIKVADVLRGRGLRRDGDETSETKRSPRKWSAAWTECPWNCYVVAVSGVSLYIYIESSLLVARI